MKTIALCAALACIAGCASIAPPRDFPVLPLPRTPQLEPVDGVRMGRGSVATEDGFFLSDAEYVNATQNIGKLLADNSALRAIIERYNEWALENGAGD